MKNRSFWRQRGIEKLKTAVDFGADAVYLGGKKYSLRAFAGNFSLDEMARELNMPIPKAKRCMLP